MDAISRSKAASRMAASRTNEANPAQSGTAPVVAARIDTKPGAPADANRLRSSLATLLGAPTFARYFDGQTRFYIDGVNARVSTTSRFHSAVLDRRFGPQIRKAVAKATGRDAGEIDLQFEVDEKLAPEQPQQEQAVPPAARSNARSVGKAKKTYRDAGRFLVGESNRLAYDAVCRLCQDGLTALSPLVIHGPCGVGKTHLLNTAAAMFESFHSGAGVRIMTADAFTTGFVTAIREGQVDRFRNRIRSLDLLCLDDTHFLSTRDATQGELVQTLDAVGVSGARILLASDEHPRKIGSLRAALRSRLLSGMVVHVNNPDRELCLGLVKLFAQQRGFELSNDAAATLVRIVASNPAEPASVRELMGAVNKLAATRSLMSNAAGEAAGLEVGPALVRRAFDADLMRDAAAGDTFEGIAAVVCDELGIDRAELGGKKRHKRLVAARAVITLLCRERTTLSYPDIARSMDKPSHSTVITAAQRLTKQMQANEIIDLGAQPPGALAGMTAGSLVDLMRSRLGGAI